MSEGPNHDRFFSMRLMIGLWIIAMGMVLLAGNLGWIETRSVFRVLWPLALVFFGVGLLTRTSDEGSGNRRRPRNLGWVLVIVGGWQFFDNVGWVDLSLWQLILPAVLLFAGGTMVWRAFVGPAQMRTPDASAGNAGVEDHAEFVRSFAVMSGNELRPISRPFRGADLSAVMAGIKLDLTAARMEGDNATIEVFAFWGGMEIYVPPDWTVTSKVVSVMGGFIDKRRPTSTAPSKTLMITGFIIMSGIEIKN